MDVREFCDVPAADLGLGLLPVAAAVAASQE